MYTIKRAVELTGIPAGTLRAWESRYGIGASQRTDSGYRVYSTKAISEILHMKELVAQGWSHLEAAREVQANPVGPAHQSTVNSASSPTELSAAMVPEIESGEGELRYRGAQSDDDHGLPIDPTSEAPELAHEFLDSARDLDEEKLSSILDQVFARGSFESVVDNWLIPTLRILGNEWVAGKMDIAAEHFASGAIMRRLGNALESSAINPDGRKVIVGTPHGSFHEMGALSLAIALRRRGVGVIYLGNNVPAQVWVNTAEKNNAIGVVIPVVMKSDIPTAQEAIDTIINTGVKTVIAVGGAQGSQMKNATVVLTGGLADSAKELAQIFADSSK